MTRGRVKWVRRKKHQGHDVMWQGSQLAKLWVN